MSRQAVTLAQPRCGRGDWSLRREDDSEGERATGCWRRGQEFAGCDVIKQQQVWFGRAAAGEGSIRMSSPQATL